MLSCPLLRVVREAFVPPRSRRGTCNECPDIRDLLTRGLGPHKDPQRGRATLRDWGGGSPERITKPGIKPLFLMSPPLAGVLFLFIFITSAIWEALRLIIDI